MTNHTILEPLPKDQWFTLSQELRTVISHQSTVISHQYARVIPSPFRSGMTVYPRISERQILSL